jgi:hypothetical protein
VAVLINVEGGDLQGVRAHEVSSSTREFLGRIDQVQTHARTLSHGLALRGGPWRTSTMGRNAAVSGMPNWWMWGLLGWERGRSGRPPAHEQAVSPLEE